jgi:hypothetical protein
MKVDFGVEKADYADRTSATFRRFPFPLGRQILVSSNSTTEPLEYLSPAPCGGVCQTLGSDCQNREELVSNIADLHPWYVGYIHPRGETPSVPKLAHSHNISYFWKMLE